MNRLISRWRNAALATQFAVAGGIVMLVAMLVVGQWVAARISETVIRNWANATALYMESFISPLSQDLADSDELSPLAHRALDEVFTSTSLGARVVSYKIWKEQGRIIDASDHALLGRQFPVGPELRAAWAGEVSASLADLTEQENAGEAALGVPLLEIYSPIREVWSGRVIGVVEFYERADALVADLTQARRRSWGAVAAVFGAIGLVLWGIVARGSRLIVAQAAELQQQVAELAELSAHNTALRLRVQGAAGRISALHDQVLRQVGADLHDGPAQQLAFAALRMDSLAPHLASDGAPLLAEMERAVKDAIREIRSISRGVALPDIAERCPCAFIADLAETHRARSGTDVEVTCLADDLPPLDAAVKTCLYRFVQEGLTNAWRHAEGREQAVWLGRVGDRLVLCVTDRGPGPGTRISGNADGGLGLAGLRDRVEALGGLFDIRARDGGGTELSMELQLGQNR